MIICSFKVKSGFSFMYTPAVVFFTFGSSHKVLKSDGLVLHTASSLIVGLNGGVHYPMNIPYKLIVLFIKISYRSMYCLTRISHIIILIFYSSYVSVRSSGICLRSKFVTGSFISVIISTVSSAFLKFFRTEFFRTSCNLSNLTPWSSL